jgi:peptidoglycan-associated lipoprotein
MRIGQFARGAAVAGLALSAAACSHLRNPMTRAQIERPAASCIDFTASLYFERNSAAVTREAKEVLKGARAQTKGCEVSSVEVVGLADAVGAQDANLELSKARARAVTATLAHSGFREVSISAVAVGDAGAVNANGVAPLRRRADIIFHVKKP